MYKPKYAPWENVPKKLTQKEIINPMSVLIDFFSADHLEGHQQKLKEWKYYVMHDKCYKDKRHGPGSLLFTYDLSISLLEAMCLLYHDCINNAYNRIAVSELQLEDEKKELDETPNNLSQREMLNPYKAVKDLFKQAGLQEYRDYLHEFLYAALYIKGGDDELHHKEIKLIFKNMLKLYSASWLIYNREIKRQGHTG